MRKLLLGTAAVALGMTFVAAEASAEVKLEVGGHTKLYASWLDQDTTSNDPATAANESEDERAFDILRETEVQFSGETTLDNGLTVGAHIEADIDGNGAGDEFNTEEAYAYFSGAWGRVNFGAEDGAAYLLQVAAPSADSNFDGIRQYVDPVNNTILKASGAQAVVGGVNTPVAGAFGDNVTFDDIFDTGLVVNDVIGDVNGSNTSTGNDILVGANGVGILATARFDYDQAVTGTSDKLTYMTPVFNGFQAGVSYTPEIGAFRDLGNNDDDDVFGAANPGAGFGDAEWGDVFDVAARYEGMLGEVGIAIGGGYTHASLEADDGAAVFYQSANATVGFDAGDVVTATLDDREAWNVGVDFDWGPFGLGGSYSEDDNGVSGDNLQTATWVVGVDYTTGPFKLGASYYNQDQDVATSEIETDRWTGGVVYTYGPGMTFRGSVSYIEFEEDLGFENSDADATSVLLGTQINF